MKLIKMKYVENCASITTIKDFVCALSPLRNDFTLCHHNTNTFNSPFIEQFQQSLCGSVDDEFDGELREVTCPECLTILKWAKELK